MNLTINKKNCWKVAGIATLGVGAVWLGIYSWPLLLVVFVMAAFVSLGFFMEPPKR